MRKKNISSEFVRQCLCISLIRLMGQKKFDEITVSEICQVAGFGRTTYYRYFSGEKTELLIYIGSAKWKEAIEEKPEEYKKSTALFLANYAYENKDFFLLLEKHHLTSLVFEMFYSTFGKNEETDKPTLLGKSFISGGLFGIVYQWVKEGCKQTPEEIKENFLLALKAAEKERAERDHLFFK